MAAFHRYYIIVLCVGKGGFITIALYPTFFDHFLSVGCNGIVDVQRKWHFWKKF